jgi:hypothetical protein
VKRAILNGTRWERICDAGDLVLVDISNLSPLPVSWSYDQVAPLGYIDEVVPKPMPCCFAIKEEKPMETHLLILLFSGLITGEAMAYCRPMPPGMPPLEGYRPSRRKEPRRLDGCLGRGNYGA